MCAFLLNMTVTTNPSGRLTLATPLNAHGLHIQPHLVLEMLKDIGTQSQQLLNRTLQVRQVFKESLTIIFLYLWALACAAIFVAAD